MKLHVICDQDGNIASLHSGSVSGPQASISAAGVKPGPGQTLHTVEVSAEIQSLSLTGIHREFKVKLGDAGATLVRLPHGK
ncbi:MAG: hypothetical protein ACRESI_05330 [Gammaproteobacteria bacterium]